MDRLGHRAFTGAMIDGYPRTLTVIAALGAALSAGVFFAFSTFVMQALRRLPDDEGLAAMRAINKAAPTPLFMLALFGTAVLCLVLGVIAVRHLDEPWAAYLVAGAALYLVAIVLTVAYHVPRNDALALVDPHGSGAAQAWTSYAGPWTAWNHLRTLGALAGAVSFVLALGAG
jgi:uncharacterized membrane protein